MVSAVLQAAPMRRTLMTAATAVVLLTGVASPAVAGDSPSPAVPAVSDSTGWVPAPTPPFSQEAGLTCDFAFRAEPVVDEVVTKVLRRYPDGAIRWDAYKGALVVRVTNSGNGRSYDADVSGSAVVEHAPDGGAIWNVVGPVLLGVRAGGGNIPRGLWVIDGVYRLQISASGYRTVTMVHGRRDNVCDHLG
ncbi:hypothetical protein ACGFJ7_18230 [Actinoplanes sp. NPDC048988]|uniref:hypothetical protein n=1 Tax=Actinoplanes sp. NPDC048988 TaxID=3363901 RepID=UPI003723ADA1